LVQGEPRTASAHGAPRAEPLFAGQGHFSHINPALLYALRGELGALTWFDAREAIRGPRSVARGVIAALVRHPELVGAPRSLYHARIKTTPMFDAMSRATKKAAKGIDAPFVIQTQGLFNGYIDGRPLFVYTDYTELANLHATPGHKTNSVRWLERERLLFEQAEVIFAASSDARTSLVRDYGIPETKVVLTNTGLNVAAPEHLPVRDRNRFDVLFVGTEWERKGGPDVLRAFAQVRQRVPYATLTVVGCRPSGNPPPAVRFVGKIPPTAVGAHFASASVFCLPAHQEPAGIAYSEAAAWGLPVVSTTAGNIPDRVVHGRTGLLVEPGDVEGLTAALLRLANDPELRLEFGNAGRAYALENFSWRQIARAIAEAARPYLTFEPLTAS